MAVYSHLRKSTLFSGWKQLLLAPAMTALRQPRSPLTLHLLPQTIDKSLATKVGHLQAFTLTTLSSPASMFTDQEAPPTSNSTAR
jgi:hypothetical protein